RGIATLSVSAYQVVSGPGLGCPPRLRVFATPILRESGQSRGLLESARAGRDEQFSSGENARSADACIATRERDPNRTGRAKEGTRLGEGADRRDHRPAA